MACVTILKLLESVLVRSIYNKRTTINNWKIKSAKDSESREGQFTEVGRPNKVNDEVMLKIKEAVIGIRSAGALISRKVVISIGTRVLKANNRNLLSRFEGNVILTDMWARGVLKSMNCVKRIETTHEIEPSKQLLAEEKFTFL